jgi:hypothetical protein
MAFFDVPPLAEDDFDPEPDVIPEARWLGGLVPVAELIGFSRAPAGRPASAAGLDDAGTPEVGAADQTSE